MKRLTVILIAMMLAGASCQNESKTIAEKEDTTVLTETSAENGDGVIGTDWSESSQSETADDNTASEDAEEVIELAGKETEQAETEPETIPQTPPNPEAPSAGDKDPFVMTIPARYTQIYDKLQESMNDIRYDEIWIDEVVEEEAVMEAPAISMDYSAAVDAVLPEAEESFKNSVTTEPDAFSKTNTQIAEIDEGDIVKTDGEYIYVLKDQEFLLILSAAGAETEVISKTELNMDDEDRMWAEELYIYGDTLLILSGCMEYGVNQVHSVKITAFDVSDPADPDRIAYNGQDGNYVTSRLMDDDLYVITKFSIPTWIDFDEKDYESYVPGLYTNGVKTLTETSCIVYPPVVESARYTVISRYSASSGSLEITKSVLGAGETVYMSTEHLYLADARYYHEESDPYMDGVYSVTDHTSGTRTEILKFSLSDDLRTEAVGKVDGTLLNQFALDEKDGFLRVVTTYQNEAYSVYIDAEHGFTNYKWHDSMRRNGLFVFDEEMEIIGKIDGLAEGEKVYSVRFSGDVGYFVTYRTVDPLFTVDLTDPTAPKILSELKIPGFSEYLHPYADGLLFGLGQNADENTGRTTGMKLSMFDVSDPYNVTEKHKLSLDFSYSEALNNHKAILISADKNLIGFPYSGGYVIYGYGDNGFYERSRIELGEIKWKGDSRGLYAGDAMYIVAQTAAAVLDMNDFTVLTTVNY